MVISSAVAYGVLSFIGLLIWGSSSSSGGTNVRRSIPRRISLLRCSAGRFHLRHRPCSGLLGAALPRPALTAPRPPVPRMPRYLILVAAALVLAAVVRRAVDAGSPEQATSYCYEQAKKMGLVDPLTSWRYRLP